MKSELSRWQPPRFLRHITPWWFLRLLDEYLLICWAKVVSWKLGFETEDWQPDKSCFFPYDYCGKYEFICKGYLKKWEWDSERQCYVSKREEHKRFV